METNRIYFQLFSLNFLLDFGLRQKNIRIILPLINFNHTPRVVRVLKEMGLKLTAL